MKDIKILAVDTSGTTLAIALLKNYEVLASVNKNTGRTHSETLMPEIISLFEKAGLLASDIDYFVCSNGPGSFTGLRIGISALIGLAHAVNKPMVEVGTLDGLYKNNEGKCNIICPIIDARREEVYATVFKGNEKILSDRPISLVSLCELLKEHNEKVLFCGDGAIAYKEKILEYMCDKAIFADEKDMLQNAVSVGLLGLNKIKKGEAVPSNQFKVNYLKPSQPEMQLNKAKD